MNLKPDTKNTKDKCLILKQSLTYVIKMGFCYVLLANPLFAAQRTELMHFSWGSGAMQLGGPRNNLGDGASENLGPQCIAVTEHYLFVADRANQRLLAYDKGNKLYAQSSTSGNTCPLVGGDGDQIFIHHQRGIDIYNAQLSPVQRVQDQLPTGSPFNMDVAYDAPTNGIMLWSVSASEMLTNHKKQASSWSVSMYESGIVNEIERSSKQITIGVKIPDGHISSQYIFEIEPPIVTWRGIRLIGIDKYGNTFFKATEVLGLSSDSPTKAMIRKYSASGQFISEVQLDYDDKLFFDQDYAVTLDAITGNLFHLNIKRSGPVLIRWEL